MTTTKQTKKLTNDPRWGNHFRREYIAVLVLLRAITGAAGIPLPAQANAEVL